jgi:hypothetical protein
MIYYFYKKIVLVVKILIIRMGVNWFIHVGYYIFIIQYQVFMNLINSPKNQKLVGIIKSKINNQPTPITYQCWLVIEFWPNYQHDY